MTITTHPSGTGDDLYHTPIMLCFVVKIDGLCEIIALLSFHQIYSYAIKVIPHATT